MSELHAPDPRGELPKPPPSTSARFKLRSQPRTVAGVIFVGTLAALFALKSLLPARAPADAAETQGEATEDAPPASVELATALVRPMETTLSAQGILSPSSGALARVSVAAPARLSQVLVREGQAVSAGQIVATLDNRSAQAAAEGASAALDSARSDARGAELATRSAQVDQSSALAQAQAALQSAQSERAGAVNQAQIALRAAQSDARKVQITSRAPDASNAVQQAGLAVQSARLDRDAAAQAARNALESAQTDLQKLRAGALPQEIAQAQAQVEQAEATQVRAGIEVERVQFLFDKGIKAKRELDDAKTALNVAGSALRGAQNALALLRAGARGEDVRAAELKVEGTRQALESATQSGAAKVRQAQSALDLARAQSRQAARQRPEDARAASLKVAAARDALSQAQASGDAQVLAARLSLEAARKGGLQIAARAEDARSKASLARSREADLSASRVAASQGELRAPIGGVVTRRAANAGDVADPATPILEITDSRALTLQASLPAESAAQVLAGQLARVSSESAPGKSFAARVESVGQVDPQSGLASVRVSVFGAGALKIGALASCDIVVARRPAAVVAPRQAVITRDGKPTIFVAKSDGTAEAREVTVGEESGGLIEIRKGLSPGEKVIRLGQYELEDGAHVRAAP